MKKQIKNKNTARAIAFVLATVVMATSIPMTALAEGETPEEFTLTEENKTSDDATTESNELDGSETKATLGLADIASESVNNMENVIKAENNDLGVKDYADKVDEIYEDLDKASELVYNISSKEDGEEGYVANLEQKIKNALVAGEKIDNILQGVSAEDGKVLVDVPVVDENGEPATEQVDLNESIKPIQDEAFYNDEKTGLNAGLDAVTISQQKAEEANDSSKSVEERKEAQTEAENQLNIADSILKKANEDVDKAQEVKDAAKKKLDEAIKVRDAVLNSTEAAEECYIKGAVKDSEAAFKAIKDAKDKAGELQEEVDELYANIKNIELLEQIQAKQKTIQEIVKDDQDFKTNPDYQKATKELCSLIIQYNILDKDGKDIELGTDFEVTLIQHDPEDLQNATLDEKTNMFTLGEKEVSYTQGKDEDGWLKFNADMENCFVVKFKDKDDKEYTRYYNYYSNNDGSICVYERSYTVNTEDVDEVPAIEPKEGQVIPSKPGTNAYTDETGIAWKTDDDSILAAEDKYVTSIEKDDEGHVISAQNVDEYNYLNVLENMDKKLIALEKKRANLDEEIQIKKAKLEDKEKEYTNLSEVISYGRQRLNSQNLSDVQKKAIEDELNKQEIRLKDKETEISTIEDKISEAETKRFNINDQTELLEQIQAKQEVIQKIVDSDKSFKTNSDYKKATRELCSLIIKYNILVKEGSIIEVGTALQVTLAQHDTDLGNASFDEKTNMYTLARADKTITLEKDKEGWLENCIVAKFKDKEGNEYTRYYNYISNDDGTICIYERNYDVETKDYDEVPAVYPGINGYTDETGITWDSNIDSILEAFENGYIKEVQIDDEENIISAKNVDEYNYLILLDNLQKYQEQKEALDKANGNLLVAQEKFETLRDQAKKLKMYVYDTKELEYLENQVNIAESALSDAKATRDKLEEEVTKTKEIIEKIVIPEPEPSSSVGEKPAEAVGGEIAKITVDTKSGENGSLIKKGTDNHEEEILKITAPHDSAPSASGDAGRVKPDTPSGVAGVRVGDDNLGKTGTPSGVAGVRVDNGDSKKNDKPELGVKTNDNTKFEPSITVAQKDTNKDVTTNKTNINVTDLVNDKPWDEYNSGVSPVYFALLVALAAAAVAGAGTAFGISRRKRALRENMKKKK